MEIYLDGARQLTLQSNVPTVGAALVELNAWLQGNGRALQRVSIDGREIPAEELTREIGNIPAARVGRLEVMSARVVDLVIEALDEVQNVLPEMPVACQSLAQILAGESPADGLEPLTQVLNIWGALQERRRQIADALQIELGAIEIGGRSLSERDADLAEALRRVQAALNSGDYVALSDLLAYDLFGFAEQELEVFAVLRARCAPAA